jgi:hypothetical protein
MSRPVLRDRIRAAENDWLDKNLAFFATISLRWLRALFNGTGF